MSERAYILCRFARESSLYQPWLHRLSIPVEVVDAPLIDWQTPADAAILITHIHYRWDEYQVLRRLYHEDRVPVLILADGILEYRNLYEHPDLADGCIFQPVVGHKLACLGKAQARMVESWGNAGKCELVGLPRLDVWLDRARPPIAADGPFRLLIATATTPAFNTAQRRRVMESLGHLKRTIEEMQQVGGRPIKVYWRLTDGFDFELGLSSAESEQPQAPLTEVIGQVDAVMTTPSTLFLESALLGRPTAILDFHHTPQFVAPAWIINGPDQMPRVISELARPPAPKMAFQEATLHDQLQCHGSATERLLGLIDVMIEAGRVARAAGTRVHLPARIIEDAEAGFTRVGPYFDLTQLFPDNAVFRLQELAPLQVELNLAIERLKDKEEAIKNLQAQLAYLRKRVSRGKAQYKTLKERLLRARERLKNFRGQVARLMEQVASLSGKPPVPPNPSQETSTS